MSIMQGGRGHWSVNYSGTQNTSFKNFSYFYKIMIGLFQTGIVQFFKPIILIFKRGNFIYHHLGCKPNNCSLSYP